MKRLRFSISNSGRVRAIYSDELAPLIESHGGQVRRASHVEPDPAGGWQADLAPVGGPVLGPFQLRQEALDAEVEYLEHMMF